MSTSSQNFSPVFGCSVLVYARQSDLSKIRRLSEDFIGVRCEGSLSEVVADVKAVSNSERNEGLSEDFESSNFMTPRQSFASLSLSILSKDRSNAFNWRCSFAHGFESGSSWRHFFNVDCACVDGGRRK